MKTPSLFVKEVQTEDWRIGYYSGYPPMASFARNGNVPLLVTEYYCAVCVDEYRRQISKANPEGELDCIHKALMRNNQPGKTAELSPAELDNDDAWEDWRNYNETVRAGLRGLA